MTPPANAPRRSSVTRTWLLRATISLVVAIVLLRVVPLSAVVDALRRTSIPAWLTSLAVFFVGHYFNAAKLRLLAGNRRVPQSAFVRAQYAGLVANFGLPGIAGGDLARAAYLVPSVGATRIALASVADRILDMSVLMLLVSVGVIFAGAPPALVAAVHIRTLWLGTVLAGAVTAIAGLVLLRKRPRTAETLARAWAEFRLRRFSLVAATLISTAVQSAFVLTNVWLARFVGVRTGVAAWFVAWPLSKLVAVLPISLGGLGVREAALVSLLATYGAPRDGVLASGILWQGVLIVSALTGLLTTQLAHRPAAPVLESADRAS